MRRPAALTPELEAILDEILRRIKDAKARGEDPLAELVRDEIEGAYARTQKERR